MPPLETEIAVETEERVRFDYHTAQALRELCSLIKRLMSERLRSVEDFKEITERKPDQSQNGVAEVNAKQEKQPAGKEEK